MRAGRYASAGSGCDAGRKDERPMQVLKGPCREVEAECGWGYIGWQIPDISHFQLGLCTAGIFAPVPTHQHGVVPILDLMHDLVPGVVSVAPNSVALGSQAL